jgi:hypothetical protein
MYMNFKLIIPLLLLSLLLFGCTSSGVSIPYTTSQLIARSTDLNYAGFVAGDYNGLCLRVDGNVLTAGSCGDSNVGTDWSDITGFPSGCSDGQAVQVIGATLTCIDVGGNYSDTNVANYLSNTYGDLNNDLNYLQSGNNISLLYNDSGYITSYTDTNAHTACDTNEVLLGQGSCLNINSIGGSGGGSSSDTWADVMARGNQSDTNAIIDVTNSEAFLVRKDSDGGDLFKVDTSANRVIVGSATTSGSDYQLSNAINSTATLGHMSNIYAFFNNVFHQGAVNFYAPMGGAVEYSGTKNKVETIDTITIFGAPFFVSTNSYGMMNEVVTKNIWNNAAMASTSEVNYGLMNNVKTYTEAKQSSGTLSITNYGIYNGVNTYYKTTNAGATIESSNTGLFNYLSIYSGNQNDGTMNGYYLGAYQYISQSSADLHDSVLAIGENIAMSSSLATPNADYTGIKIDVSGGATNKGIVLARDGAGGDILFGAGQDASITYDGTNMILDPDTTGTDSGVVYIDGNVSATGFITRTERYDKSQGLALEKIIDSDLLVDSKNTIDHSKYYGFVEFEVTDFDRPVVEEYDCSYEDDKGKLVEGTCYRTIYPYKKIEQGVNAISEIELLRQAIVELKTIISSMQSSLINTINRVTGAETKISELEIENDLIKSELCSKDSSYSWCKIEIIK